MEKRKFEKFEKEVSLLGFGCMRFPLNDDKSINEVEAEKMLDHAISKGVNYLDTAYPYHGGKSEPFVGKVIKKYQRQDFYLATKLPMWLVESKDDVEKYFNEQLERLDVDYVDFYLLHALNRKSWKKVIDFDVISACEKLREQGKIKYLGFSFHDQYNVFEEIINHYNWDFCQIQYNYIDTNIQAGDKGYELAEKLGIPVIIMEPVKGGQLASLPQDINEMLKNHNPSASQASWALRWAGSKANTMTVLSGMSTMEQVEDNINTFTSFKPLDNNESLIIKNATDILNSRLKNGCTGCNYCMPCPFSVNIPSNFRFWNEGGVYQDDQRAIKKLKENLKDAERASECKDCGKCEELCPQKINIREDLKKIVQYIA